MNDTLKRRNEAAFSNFSYLKSVSEELRRFRDGLVGSLSKPRRRRQRERHQTKALMSRTIAVQKCLVCKNVWCVAECLVCSE